jgi:LuxR family transcriptional regulator, maltose regulon positive regulatory protein
MPDVVDRANDALRRGAWQDAKIPYEDVLQAFETPEPLAGLGKACWWLDDVARVGEARERAYLLYRQRGDALGAARVALALAEDALIFRGEEAVMNGWTERARRLLGELAPSPEHALLAVHDAFSAFMLTGDMQVARRRAAEAIDLARRFELFDLEMYARSIDGVARVRQGHVAQGMPILDEATAAATSGEMRDVALIGYTCCFMI